MDIPVLTTSKINIHQLCVDTGCHLDDFQRVMANGERESREFMLLTHFDDDDVM